MMSKVYVLEGNPLCAFDFSLDGTEDGMFEDPEIGVPLEYTYGFVLVSDVVIILWSTGFEAISSTLVDEDWLILIFNEVINTGYLPGSFDGYNDGNI